jgi:SAD/SRA domain
LNENEANVYRRLRKIGQHIKKLKARPLTRNTVHDEIITWLWSMQSLDSNITQEVLTQSSVLTMLKNFLSEEEEAFRYASRFPIDLEEDLTYLLRKWTAGDLDNDPDRGLLVTRKSNSVESLKLDKTWEHLRKCNYFGSGNLVNGQRWPGRIHMRRDGAHGASMAGIYGPSVAEGAQALVMGLHGQNCNYYADRDEGNRVKYIGTARKKKGSYVDTGVLVDNSNDDEEEDRPTAHTRMLMTSIETGKPVRLFRSDKLPDINPYRPLKGYRYDGLYRVVSCELLEDERKIYGFELQRLPGQGPIRRNDFRTFEETHQQAERRRRRTEASMSSRASLRVYN